MVILMSFIYIQQLTNQIFKTIPRADLLILQNLKS